MHAKIKSTGEEYAMKVMEKDFIKREDKVRFVMQEKTVLSKIRHPFIIRLLYSFQVRPWRAPAATERRQGMTEPRRPVLHRTGTICTWRWSCVRAESYCP